MALKKEPCFIIYNCNSSKAEKCMKNVTEKCENQFNWQKITQIFCF